MRRKVLGGVQRLGWILVAACNQGQCFCAGGCGDQSRRIFLFTIIQVELGCIAKICHYNGLLIVSN